MKTNKVLVMSMLAAAFMCSCSSEEEPAVAGGEKAISLSAGINDAVTRAVISSGYNDPLNVTFGRIDNPTGASTWQALNAVRAGGSGNTAISFSAVQTYAAANVASYLVGFYPRASFTSTSDPATVSYAITGDQDLMATAIQEGKADTPFEAFTFNHLLSQLQFKCLGSEEAKKKWGAIKSVKVKDVPSNLVLAINKNNRIRFLR